MPSADAELSDIPEPNVIQLTGRNLLEAVQNSGQALIILVQAFLYLPAIVTRRKEVCRQMYICGVKSLPVTEIVALFTGMILSLQAGLELRNFHQEVNVGIIVSQTMCREMGPFMTALILAASVGSAMAAELGTMKVSEEIDALKVMSINPVRYLVMPRLAAMMVMVPVLTVFTNIVGIIGGGLVANTQLDVSWVAYKNNVFELLKNKEIFVGLFKAWVFGIIVATISCYQGLATTNGAVGVGIATRRAVVYSFLLVLIVGYFITRFFY